MGGIRYKVRTSKQIAQAPCAVEMATLLACFATTSDLRAAGEGPQGCAAAARSLHACMAKPRTSGGRKTSSINHLLQKVRK